MKKIFASVLAVLSLGTAAFAQTEFTPEWVLSGKTGASILSGVGFTYPSFTVGAAYQFTPAYSVRAELAGYALQKGETFNNGVSQLNLDVALDLCNLFSYNPQRFVSPYIFLGTGANVRYNENLSPVVRGGLGLDFKRCGNFGLGLEFAQTAVFAQDLAMRSDLLLGVKYHFGSSSCATKCEAAINEVKALQEDLARKQDELAGKVANDEKTLDQLAKDLDALKAAEAARAAKEAEEAAEAARRAAAPVSCNVYFELGRSAIGKTQKGEVASVIAALNAKPGSTVTLSGFADKFTGNSKSNLKLSQKRAENVCKALVEAGIDASRITISYYGDKEQVSEIATENRVVICVVK